MSCDLPASYIAARTWNNENSDAQALNARLGSSSLGGCDVVTNVVAHLWSNEKSTTQATNARLGSESLGSCDAPTNSVARLWGNAMSTSQATNARLWGPVTNTSCVIPVSVFEIDTFAGEPIYSFSGELLTLFS